MNGDVESRLWKQIHDMQRQLASLRNPAAYSPDRTVFASYSTDAGQSIDNASATIINFEDKTADTHSAVTVGASWKFTAPVRRVYTLHFKALFASTTAWALGEIGSALIYKNGSVFRSLYRRDTMNSSAGALLKEMIGGISLLLEGGDYIDLRAYQNTGGALALQADGSHNWITIIGRRD